MLGLRRLTAALNRFTAAIEALADTAREVNQGVRARLALNVAEGLPTLPAPADTESEPGPRARKTRSAS